MGLRDSISRLFRGSAPVDSTDQDWLREVADFGDQRLADYDLYGRFYDGNHGLELTGRLKHFLEGNGIPFSENYCDAVIDYLADILEVESFSVADNEEATDWVNGELLPSVNFSLLQQTVHTMTPMLGDGFVIVGFDDDTGEPTIDWNHPRLIKVVYDDERDEIAYAVKKWATRTIGASEQNPKGRVIWRMNVYFPDRIEKWFSADEKGETWAQWFEDDDTDPEAEEPAQRWPLDWTDEEGEPLGVNVFHFRNRAMGRALGRSDLLGAIPFQRELNKQVLDLSEVLDQMGAPQRWGSGIDADRPLRVRFGEYLKATDANARFGQLEPADPTQAVDSLQATMRRMGVKTGTPFALGISEGNLPSGESLKTARMRLTERGKRCQVSYGRTHCDYIAYAWKLLTVFGDRNDVPEYDPEVKVTANWAGLEIRDAAEEATIAEADLRLGVSRATLLRQRGYDPEEELEARAKEDAQRSEARAAAFSAGDPSAM